jgi:hypothetical protein
LRDRFLVLTGEPIDEPISGYGRFLMNTRDEIMTAMKDLQEGRFGELATDQGASEVLPNPPRASATRSRAAR